LQVATSTPSGLPSAPITPNGGEEVSQLMRITFSFRMRSSVELAGVWAAAGELKAARLAPTSPPAPRILRRFIVVFLGRH